MNRCCNGSPAAPAVPARTTSAPSRPPTRNVPTPVPWRRRIGTLTQWALPLVTLALVPKCPACFAAYVLLFTGIGLSIPAATATRWTLIALIIFAAACLLIRASSPALPVRLMARWRPASSPTPVPEIERG